MLELFQLFFFSNMRFEKYNSPIKFKLLALRDLLKKIKISPNKKISQILGKNCEKEPAILRNKKHFNFNKNL